MTEATLSNILNTQSLAEIDPEISEAIEKDRLRQQDRIELIASENFTLPAVMEACGSVLTNKYAEGYPNKRYYGGCENADVVEQLAIDRAKQLFKAEYANVQPHSGSQANMGVYFAALNPGDKILTMELSHGGHLTHGSPVNFSGKLYDVVHYGVDERTGRINYDNLAEIAAREKPKMITVGASAYARTIDFERMGAIAPPIANPAEDIASARARFRRGGGRAWNGLPDEGTTAARGEAVGRGARFLDRAPVRCA